MKEITIFSAQKMREGEKGKSGKTLGRRKGKYAAAASRFTSPVREERGAKNKNNFS